MAEKDVRHDPFRTMARTENPFPPVAQLHEAYRLLEQRLPPTTIPHVTTYVDRRNLAPDELISIAGVGGAVIVPGIGSTVDPRALHALSALGISTFEYPPQGIGLNEEFLTAFIRNDPTLDPEFRERFARTIRVAIGYRVDEKALVDRAKEVINREIPMGIVCATYAAQEALKSFARYVRDKTGKEILDSDGRLLPEYAERAIVINGDNGGGNPSVEQAYEFGGLFPESVVFYLSPTLTNIVANHTGIRNTKTVAGACAGFGVALREAEENAAGRKSRNNLFLLVAASETPVGKSQKLFQGAGITPSPALPGIGISKRGYVEGPGVEAKIVITKELVDQLGLPYDEALYLHTEEHQLKNVWGVGSDTEIAYLKAFAAMHEFLPEDLPLVLFMVHGVNTPGVVFEQDALKRIKREKGLEKYREALFNLSSLADLISHHYNGRTATSMLVIEYALLTGVFPGLSPMQLDLRIFDPDLEKLMLDPIGDKPNIAPTHETLQEIRRQAYREATGREVNVEKIIFADDLEEHKLLRNQAPGRLGRIAKAGIQMQLATVRIPKEDHELATIPAVVAHAGIGGKH